MSSSTTATFDTRRDADMVIERLVQEFGVERTDIFVVAEGEDNTAGIEGAGSDGAHQGGITVSVDVNDDALLQKIRDAFEEFNGAAEVRG